MLLRIAQSPHTFTVDRVRKILQDDTYTPQPREKGSPTEFHCAGTSSYRDSDGTLHILNSWMRRKRADDFCNAYYRALRDPLLHCSCLDEQFAKLVVCHFRPTQPPERIAEHAIQMLSRLPAEPIEMPETELHMQVQRLPRFYFTGNAAGPKATGPCWTDLQVVKFVSTNVIRLCLEMVMADGTSYPPVFRRYVDTIAELLEAADRLSKKTANFADAQRWLVVRAFIWTS